MARRNQEFHPDAQNRDVLGKLLLTQKQRKRLLKWLLFTAVCLLGLLVQDVLMSRVDILGATTDLTVCCILAVCILQGAHSGSIFALCAAAVFYFSGSAPGPYCILLLTAIGIFAAMFRQTFLSQGFFTLFLCVGGGMLLYEMAVFAIGLFLGHTTWARMGVFILTAVLSLVVVPLVYPVFVSIGKIGGELWKE